MFKHLWRIPLALLLARSCGGVGGDRIPHTDIHVRCRIRDSISYRGTLVTGDK